MDIYVVHVLAGAELDPDLQGDLRLVDCEDGDVAEVTINATLLKRYKQTLAAFVERGEGFLYAEGHYVSPGPKRGPGGTRGQRIPAGTGARAMMWPELANTLTWWQWTILAAVPPAIIALYFLKLKRKPVEVPSTYLWRRSIEDLHVNTVWQRLRRNLLMFLQLAVIGLVMLAVLQPGWRSQKLPGHRFIFLIDNSASMQATDVLPSRLEDAKRQALETIAAMAPGDVAMVIAFSDAADVKQSFTENAGRLRRSRGGHPTDPRTTSLLEALKVASGLANPGRSGTDPTDVQVAEALPARLFLYSDGKFDDAAGFSLGNLDAEYRPIGTPEAANVGIVAMNVRRHETKTDQLQAFARLQNFGKEQASISVELLLNDNPDPVDVARCTIDPGETHGLAFDLGRSPRACCT